MSLLRAVAWLAIAVVVPAACRTPAASADLIVHNARVYTVDANDAIAEAVAVAGDRIVAVGTNPDILKLRGDGTRMIDGRGAAVVPGLHDAHGHFAGLGESLQTVDLRGTVSYDDLIARVQRRLETAAPGEWVLGRGWDQNDWPDRAFPVHDALSAASPRNPVYLTRVDGHAGLANRLALAAAGVTRATRDPDGGRIIRTASGEPSGVLIDRARDLVTSRIPRATADQVRARVLLANERAAALGLTMVHDAGAPRQTVDVYKHLIDGGDLQTRLYVMLSGSLSELQPSFDAGPITSYGNHLLAVRSVKMQADGALGSRGAALVEPYTDEPGTNGLLITAPEDLDAMTRAAARAGFQPAIHAIGDRANRIVMDLFETVQRDVPGARDLRMRVEHAQILDAAEIPRFARLGVIASLQPTHATSDMPWVPMRIGAARTREGAYVWRTLLEAGARIAAGSDFPVEEPNPLLGFYAAVTRQDAAGEPAGGWMPEQRLTRTQALRAFTIDAAYAAHAEALVGSIEPGKLADIVVLNTDVMQVPASFILQTSVVTTIIGGDVVYQALGGLQRNSP